MSFSIDPRGTWSPVQLRYLLEVIEPEADAMGLEIIPLDITTMNDVKRYLLVMRCRKHGVALSHDEACDMCLKGIP